MQAHTFSTGFVRLAFCALASAAASAVAIAGDEAATAANPRSDHSASQAPVRSEAALPQPEQYGRAGDERLREQMQSVVHPLNSLWSESQSATSSEAAAPMPPKDAGRAGDANGADEMR